MAGEQAEVCSSFILFPRVPLKERYCVIQPHITFYPIESLQKNKVENTTHIFQENQ